MCDTTICKECQTVFCVGCDDGICCNCGHDERDNVEDEPRKED